MEASYIKPAFPGGSFSQPTPPVGMRSELLSYRATGNYYNWTVPAGVTFIKATVVGGSGTGGGTTSLGQYATATGAGGAFTVTTTRFPQNIGPSFTTALLSGFTGTQGIIFLQNMVPGTTIRITIGVAGTGGTNGVVILEY